MNELTGTKTRLLAIARELFARQGYENTSVRQITTQAGANLGAVTYHFHTKKHLYHQVLLSLTEPLIACVTAAVQDPAPPIDRIERFVRAYFDFLLENRELPAMMLHELSLSRFLPDPVRSLMERVSTLLGSIIREGQEDGGLVPGNPGLMVLSIIALPVHAVISQPIAHQVFGQDLNIPGVRAGVIDHITAFLRRSLANPERSV